MFLLRVAPVLLEGNGCGAAGFTALVVEMASESALDLA